MSAPTAADPLDRALRLAEAWHELEAEHQVELTVWVEEDAIDVGLEYRGWRVRVERREEGHIYAVFPAGRVWPHVRCRDVDAALVALFALGAEWPSLEVGIKVEPRPLLVPYLKPAGGSAGPVWELVRPLGELSDVR